MLSETHLRKLLLDILNTYGRVELGSIGRLILENQEAQISKDKILPPHEVIGFTRIIDDSVDPSFEKAISDGIITEQESEELSTYLEEQLARLDFLGSVNILDLGNLSSNDSLVEWSSEYTDHTLPIVSLPQIRQAPSDSNPQVAYVKEHKESTYQQNTGDENSNYSKFLLPIFIIGVGTFLLIFLVRGCYNNCLLYTSPSPRDS